jgi:hypothetical protein
MGVKAICSKKNNLQDAVADLCAQAQDMDPRMVLYFASSAYAPEALAQKMQSVFSGAAVFGCSTAGELISGEMMKGSIVAMLFDADVISDVCVEVVENIAQENHIPQTFQKFETYFHTPVADLDVNTYVGLILVDGLSKAEETLMEKIGDLTSLTFIGGSAGDDLKFEKTYLYANGNAYSNAAILALLKLPNGFDIIKTQSFHALEQTLEATEVDEAARKVLQFNHKPAIEAYAEALGTSPAEAQKLFMQHPLGLMFGDEPYVRSPQSVDGSDMVFFCNIREGMCLNVLSSTDMIADTRAAVLAKQAEMGAIAGMINFNCILRTLGLEALGLTQAYGQVFADIPTVGFSTYGEEYIGHVNQTATILVIK